MVLFFLGLAHSLLSQPVQQPKATMAHVPPPPFCAGPPPHWSLLHRTVPTPTVSGSCWLGAAPLSPHQAPLLLLHLPPIPDPLTLLPLARAASTPLSPIFFRPGSQNR
jgi:hypothetical protein